MRDKKQVMSTKYLPIRIGPVIQTLLLFYLLLDKWHIPEWAWGIYGAIAGLTVLGCIMAWFSQIECRPVFEDDIKNITR